MTTYQRIIIILLTLAVLGYCLPTETPSRCKITSKDGTRFRHNHTIIQNTKWIPQGDRIKMSCEPLYVTENGEHNLRATCLQGKWEYKLGAKSNRIKHLHCFKGFYLLDQSLDNVQQQVQKLELQNQNLEQQNRGLVEQSKALQELVDNLRGSVKQLDLRQTQYNIALQQFEKPSNMTLRIDIGYVGIETAIDIVTNGWKGYMLSDSDDTGNLIIFRPGTRAIHVFNPITTTLTENQAKTTINCMVNFGEEKYIVKDMYYNVHLLDRTFTPVDTLSARPGKYGSSITYVSDNECLMMEHTRSKPYNVTITKLTISSNKISTEHMVELQTGDVHPMHIEATDDRDVVFLASWKYLYRVNLNDKQYTTYDVSHYMGSVYSMYISGNTFIVGDEDGELTQFIQTGQFIRKLNDINLSSSIRGMTVRNDTLYVVGGSSKIYVFK